MRKERNSAKVAGWLGGIAATVISGYLLWYFEQPKPTPPPPTVTTFEGMVYSGSSPVAKAMVAVSLTGSAGANGPIHDITDDNGAYKIELTGLPQGTGATLAASATGYENGQPKLLAGPLQTDVRIDFPLDPVMMAAAPPPPAMAPPQQHAPIAHIPVYVPKNAALAKQFRIITKKQP
jgi:hypothetical protein